MLPADQVVAPLLGGTTGGVTGGSGGARRRDWCVAKHGRPLADRGGVLRDDVGEMQIVQRGVLQRISLMIGRNRDDDRPTDLADGELVGCEPAEIEYVGGGVEVDVSIGCPIPDN